ncbi:glycosyltransferase family protein [Spirosoma sordidisoli]|uniref:Glycosyltransferase n=1 Tax=Spirosoma sordidisoli TaxID=2502893 RepID=A0A4Q2UPH6_9BACT|nr:glycosyltransferase [Spirosoma sordidisoli]RYC69701.1 glycosyltransferase [Spirosoma sordidisoli]
MPAPIILFAYKRAHELQRTLTALQANHLAPASDLYVFVDGPRLDGPRLDGPRLDGPRRTDEAAKVMAVRALLDGLSGFRTIHRVYSDHNKGCANSIIAGVTEVLRKYPSAIVLEDDIVTSPNFLDYMNQCLTQYADTPSVFSVGGYTFPFRQPADYTDDVYFFGRTCAWGWGIWADRWHRVDWELTDFDAFMADRRARQAFNAGGTDRVRMLRRAYTKAIDAWDIRLCYSEFKEKGLTVYPTVSKTLNIGVDSIDSTTEVIFDRYKTPLDAGQQRYFRLPDRAVPNWFYTRQFQRKFSIPVRILNKIRTWLTINPIRRNRRVTS